MSKLDRIYERYSKKTEHLKANISNEDDERSKHIWLAGYKSLGENSARLILGSTQDITEDAARYAVPSLTDGEMTAYTASFSPIYMEQPNVPNDAKLHYASVFAVKPALHFRKATDKVLSKCKLIGNTQYLDTELENIWERKEVNGETYLVRKNENTPEKILKSALMAKTDSSYKVNSDSFLITHSVKPGDYVQFFALTASVDDKGCMCPFMDVAKVTSNNGDTLGIEIEEGTFNSKATISSHAVRTVIKAGANTTRQDVMDYLYKAFGDKWKDIVIKTGAFNVDGKGNVK